MKYKETTSRPNGLEMKEKVRDMYYIGAAAFLLSDLLSDADNLKVLRGLKEVLPEIKHLSGASLSGSRVFHAAHKYTRDIERGLKSGAKATPASAEAMEQFAQSAEYLERWLRVLYEVPESKHGHLDGLIRRSVEIAKGQRNEPLALALQWLESQPDEISVVTVRNKLIELKNA